VNSLSVTPLRLQFTSASPVAGLAVAERRVADPKATVICVHGGLDRGGSFSRLARRLDTFDVIAYDRRGYQGSRGVGPLGFDENVDDLVALIEREAPSAPVIVFGHSFGGLVGVGAGLRDPAGLRLLICYESPFPWLLARSNVGPDLSDDPSAEAERFFKRMVAPDVWDRLSPSEKDSRRDDGPALLSDLRVARSRKAPLDVAALQIPLVYAFGDDATQDYYQELGDELARQNPRVTLRQLVRAPHGAHLSNPDQLAALINESWSQRCASE